MAATTVQILVVGIPSANTEAMLFSLSTRGWGARNVETLAEARQALETFRFAVVLAPETLADGGGYDLAPIVSRQSGSLYVGIPLSETLWLPVVERGAIVLGQRALNANVFENEVEFALGAAVGEARTGENCRTETQEGMPNRVAPVKRGGAEAA